MDNISNRGNSAGRGNTNRFSWNLQNNQERGSQSKQNQSNSSASQYQLTQRLLPLIKSLLEQFSTGNAQSSSTDELTNATKPASANDSSFNGLSAKEADTLIYMREEEKLARDVYRTLFDQWGNQAFSNVSNSEQQHMNRMKSELDTYNLNDPVTDDTVGVFNNNELKNLYEDLIAKGSQSELDALYVGAYIEELDIIDLQKAINESNNADLDASYENLLRGSRNHLRSFVGQIEDQGINYMSQLMPQSEVDQITSENVERGGQNGQGRGQGRRFA